MASVDMVDFMDSVETEAARIEKEYLALHKDCEDNHSGLPKLPVFDYRPAL